jgi:uncharacterized protein (DUF1330 family)
VPEGYIISRADVVDPEAYPLYAAVAKAIVDHGGIVLVEGV